LNLWNAVQKRRDMEVRSEMRGRFFCAVRVNVCSAVIFLYRRGVTARLVASLRAIQD
jgi:hypothetical protein